MTTKHTRKWPFRQSDPEWKRDPMWDRKKVIEVHRKYNRGSTTRPEDLLWAHRGGNNIGTEGCLITCLAMVLRLLAAHGSRWTPRTLNQEAKELLYHTESGLAMVTLYADLVGDVTNGEVQLCAQEQYFSGERGWPRTFPEDCTVLRGYRALKSTSRRDFALMLKLGTHDDTVASHYVLVDPADPGRPDDEDVALLDPIEPIRSSGQWMLSDSHGWLLTDPDIARIWRKGGIRPRQISGAWAFARWRTGSQRSLGMRLFQSIAKNAAI